MYLLYTYSIHITYINTYNITLYIYINIIIISYILCILHYTSKYMYVYISYYNIIF